MTTVSAAMAPDQMAATATAFNQRSPAYVPPEQQGQEARNQQQYAAHDQAMQGIADQGQARQEAFNIANAVGAQGRAPAPPHVSPAKDRPRLRGPRKWQ